ncbi:MAG: acyl carrier protein [Candidatus Acidiferrum sp.]
MTQTQTQTIEDRVRDFVLKQFPLARKNGLKPEERWLESGLIDSLGILDLVHFLEEEFKVQVTDEELLPDNFQSLQAVSAFVRTKQMNSGSTAS